MLPEILILTDPRYESRDDGDWYTSQLFTEEKLLADALGNLGFRTRRVAWSRSDMDWSAVRAAILRSTWDYVEHFATFTAWMDTVETQTRLFNSPRIVRWNVDKHYLADLAQHGVTIPTTRFIEKGTDTALTEIFASSGCDEIIIKPSVSATAKDTFRIHVDARAENEALFRTLTQKHTMLVQPFLTRILSEGELSLIVINGHYTHAVRKVAKPGDFRVQDDHGGSVHPHTPTAEEIAFAEQAVAACPELPIYARVDIVRDNDGALALMELELVEPELFFRFQPESAHALAKAVAERI